MSSAAAETRENRMGTMPVRKLLVSMSIPTENQYRVHDDINNRTSNLRHHRVNRPPCSLQEPLKRKLHITMMISMLVQALYNIVDSAFVAQINENALSAVSLAFPMQNFMIAVGTGTGQISSSLSRISRAFALFSATSGRISSTALSGK